MMLMVHRYTCYRMVMPHFAGNLTLQSGTREVTQRRRDISTYHIHKFTSRYTVQTVTNVTVLHISLIQTYDL